MVVWGFFPLWRDLTPSTGQVQISDRIRRLTLSGARTQSRTPAHDRSGPKRPYLSPWPRLDWALCKEQALGVARLNKTQKTISRATRHPIFSLEVQKNLT